MILSKQKIMMVQLGWSQVETASLNTYQQGGQRGKWNTNIRSSLFGGNALHLQFLQQQNLGMDHFLDYDGINLFYQQQLRLLATQGAPSTGMQLHQEVLGRCRLCNQEQTYRRIYKINKHNNRCSMG